MPKQYRNFSRRWFSILFLGSLTICVWLGQGSARGWQWGAIATAQSAHPSQLVQQGVDHYQQGDFTAAIAPWEQALTLYRVAEDTSNAAIVLENLARAYQAIGQLNVAIAQWQQAIVSYRQLGNMPQLGRMLTEQAQIYSRLGHYRQAIALLCGNEQIGSPCTPGSALHIAHHYPDPAQEVAALGSLGEAYRLMGDYEVAIHYLQTGLDMAKTLDNPIYQMSALNSLGNAYVSLARLNYRRAASARQIGEQEDAENFRNQGLAYDGNALEMFEASQPLAQQQADPLLQLRSHLNSIPAYYRTGATAGAIAATQHALELLEQLPNSQDKAYAAIDLAHLLQPVSANESMSRFECLNAAVEPAVEPLLQRAIAIAQHIQDRRSESFALGELGHLYECRQDYAHALMLTQQARWAAEQDLDSLYLWEWQTGRILKQQGKQSDAIPVYERAIATLETIRSDILVAERDIQFDFRDTIEPIYRQLIELRLEQEQSSVLLPPSGNNNENINAALDQLDALRLAELQNYFGNDCVLIALNPQRVVDTNAETAVFSSVILDDRLAIVVTFPNGKRQIEWIDVERDTLITEVNEYRKELERFFDLYTPERSQKLYDWIIRPFVPALAQTQVKTLVFIQDGILRSVPMAALHDGEQFLVQRYAIATTPSLTLTNPTPLDRQQLQVLALGVTAQTTVEEQNFPALTNVSQEIQGIAAQLPNTKTLLNQDFTRDRLEHELNQTPYSIVHIATHSEFGTEPHERFLVTGDSQKLTISDLDTILRRHDATTPIELLSLTACKTAVGDDRAALGLAGVAAQSGVKSVLASLWFINDAATAQLMTKFYQALRDPSINKAEALRLAQLSLLEAGNRKAHPGFWAPFILIGNWQ